MRPTSRLVLWLLPTALACTPAPPADAGGDAPSSAASDVAPSTATRANVAAPPSNNAAVNAAAAARSNATPSATATATPPIAPAAAPVEPSAPATPAETTASDTTEAETTDDAPSAGKPKWVSNRFPHNIYMAYPSFEDGSWRVDAIDITDGAPESAAGALLGEAGEAVVPDGHAALPKGWHTGDAWTLVLPKGIEVRRASSFHLRIGAGEVHFEVALGPGKAQRKYALAIRGKHELALQLGAPAPVALETLAPTLLDDLTKILRAHASDEAPFRKVTPAAKHVRVFAGRFPGGRSHVIVFKARMRGDDLEGHASALLFLHDDGSLEFHSAAGELGSIEMFALLDLDGDGHDEILFRDGYYEGSYDKLLWWKDGKPKVRVLAGDGA
jgi:hypothetical protein